MARKQVISPRERKDASSQMNMTESAVQRSTSKEVGLLSRLVVRFGVAVVIVALGVLVMITQRQTPASISVSSRPGEEAQAEVERRTAARPSIEVLDKYPHDAAAFTQGFMIVKRGNEKIFIESTGLYGRSSLRYVDIESGKVLRQYDLPKELFGEGVTLGPKDELVMLTWKSKIGLVFGLEETADKKVDGFALKRKFEFDTVTSEGWGITYDGQELVVSDGSSTIMFWDPLTMKEIRRVDVTIHDGTQQVFHINELEVAKGFIYANVWYQPHILKIDPKTGTVVTMFDLSGLITDAGADIATGAVLNGIAYDDADDVFYVTGKLWNSVYKVRLLDSVQ